MAAAKRTDLNLDEFRALLLAERKRLRAEHTEQIAEVREEMEDGSTNELSHTSTFDSGDNADAGIMVAEYGREMALDENVRQMLHQIDHAMDRISDGTYGICEVTGKPIPVDRLRAVPWATMTVGAATDHEK